MLIYGGLNITSLMASARNAQPVAATNINNLHANPHGVRASISVAL